MDIVKVMSSGKYEIEFRGKKYPCAIFMDACKKADAVVDKLIDDLIAAFLEISMKNQS